MRCVPAPAVPAPRPRPASPDAAALEGVRHLAARFPAARVREVALVRAPDLDARADATGGTRIWLALEALQVTGTVKVRGALVAVAARKEVGRVVAASTGDHGVAVAYAAAVLGVEAVVVAPSTVPRVKLDAIARYGAELVMAATQRYGDVERVARQIAATRGAAFLPARDDVDMALGSGASLGFEIARALGRAPDRVLAPLGGGGVARGLSWSFAADEPEGPPRVWGVECERAAPREASWSPAGAMAGVVIVPDSHISPSAAHAYGHVGILLEEHAALPLAPVLAGLPAPLRGGDLVVVLAGRDRNPDRLEALVASEVAGGAI
jgi:threonine dehydratase